MLAKEVIIEDQATFDEIIQNYKFEVFVVSFCFFEWSKMSFKRSEYLKTFLCFSDLVFNDLTVDYNHVVDIHLDFDLF